VTVAGGPAKLEFSLDLKAGFRPRRNPAASNVAYR
jgi:hypothetical protein